MFARCLQSCKFELFKLYIMATLKFRLLSKKDNAPIYCYFSIGRGKFYQRKTRETINPENWNTKKGEPKNIQSGTQKNLNDLQKIQNEFNTNKWGKGPDVEVVANFIYSLHLIDKKKQSEIESKVSKYLRENFSFAIIEINNKEERLFWESKLISTISKCCVCKASQNWLGLFSPKEKIKNSGLYLINGLYKEDFSKEELEEFLTKCKIKNL